MPKAISFLRPVVLLVIFLFALSQRGFSQAPERIKITAATPLEDTGQDYSPWLNDDLNDLVASNWQANNLKYSGVTLSLEKQAPVSRLSLYDGNGEFADKPAYLFALNGNTKTYLGTFTGLGFQAWADIALPQAVTADAILIWKYGNNIPQKINVFGASLAGPAIPATLATPAPVPVPVPTWTPAPVPTGTKQIIVEVTFDRAPTAASSTFADLKYGKEAVFQFEVDDNNDVLLPIADYLARRSGRPTLTDGCGNAVNYRIAAAVNSRTNFNNVDLGDGSAPGKVTWAQLAAFVKDGNALENHGYYHSLWGNYGTSGDVAKNLRDNLLNVYTRLKDYGVDYRMRTVVRPNDDAGYIRAADQAGYLAATSQGMENGYQKYPAQTSTFDIQTLPAGFAHLGRSFSDLGDGSEMNAVQGDLQRILTGSNASTHLLYRLGTHIAPFWATQQIFNYLGSNANDRVWVAPMAELMEYLEVKRKVVKTETLNNNKLIITLDYRNLPAINRYRDLSLNINGGNAKIQNVAVVGADNSSYNAGRGLVNVFKQQTTFANPDMEWQSNSSWASSDDATASGAATEGLAKQLSAYPNPFTSQTTVEITLPQAEKVTLEVYDLKGRLVRRLFSGTTEAGVAKSFALNAKGLSQNVYLVRLVTPTKVLTQKLVLTQ